MEEASTLQHSRTPPLQYSSQGTFHDISTSSGVETANRFFEGTGRSYDLIVDLCTLGFDLWWKERLLRMIPPKPARIVDQACGTGSLTFKIARRFPSCRVTGVELRSEYLDLARAKARSLKLDNVDFLLGRAEEVAVEGPAHHGADHGKRKDHARVGKKKKAHCNSKSR